MPKIKVCGVTDPEFARAAAERGVDYIGAIFVESSPRRVSMEQAKRIAAALHGGAAGRLVPKPPPSGALETTRPANSAHPRLVGVFRDYSADEILAVAAAVPLDVVQLHGPYGEAAVAAIRAAGYEVWLLDAPEGSSADAVLLDGRSGAQSGGTGRLADWSHVAALKEAGRRVVLAGGLSAGNFAAAAATGADVLDFNSSLETSPGVKSIDKLDELFSH